MSEPVGRSKIVIRGSDVLKPPLLETEDAQIIEIYGPFNDLVALMVRILSEDMWGLVTKVDDDWLATLVRYGYVQPGKSIEEVIRHGLG